MFNRPPRIQIPTKEYQVELIPPPPLPSKPKINWATVGLPIFASGLVVALMFFFSSSTSGLSYLMFLPFILASVVASVISYRSQTKEYGIERESNIASFRHELDSKRTIIENYKSENLKILIRNYPSPQECAEIISRQDIRIGERRPLDDDFLCFRLGLGLADSQIHTKGIAIENRDPVYGKLYEDADELVASSSQLGRAPIICDLKKVGSIGVAGKVDDLRRFGWAAILQLITHYWPAELNVASFCSYVEVENWRWVNQIHHRSTVFPHAVIEIRDSEGVKKSLVMLEEELRRRKAQLVNMRAVAGEKRGNENLPVLVLIFDRVSNVYDHAAFAMLLKEGRDLGVYGIFLMDDVEDLPSECGAIILLSENEISYEIAGNYPHHSYSIKPDEVSPGLVSTFADELNLIKWLIPQEVTEPPTDLSLLELFPLVKLDDLPLGAWWEGDYPFQYLRAPIGKFSPTAELIFDLNDTQEGHGPHGLIGGMTGSGKSELLKTMILSLAMTHHPYDINFALIDYKGGGAFDGFEVLPHVVGVITDIQNHADYATRVIQSLSWEVKRREKILAEARQKFGLSTAHIDEYRTKLKVKIPIPRLVIIFDEFAEFQERHPDESRKLINIARVGRSLGIHLILCTQNPVSKAVDQQVRDNSNFTICLKVKSPDISKSLINIPDAILLRRGQAFFHVDGPQKFKVAFTAGDFNSANFASATTTGEANGNRKYLTHRISEAQAIIEEIGLQTIRHGIPTLPRIWPDPLPEQLDLKKLLDVLGVEQSWDGFKWLPESYMFPSMPIGLLDDPLHQKQPVFTFQNNLLLFGPSGSGKSMALISLAMGIGLIYTPKEAHVYCLDISGQSPIKILQGAKFRLPHLPREGGIIHGNDTERINRLFKILGMEIDRRGKKFSDIRSYNLAGSHPSKEPEPYIFILIDGLTQQFNTNNPGFKDQLDFVLRHGASLGIYVVMTGNLPRDIPESLQADRNIILLQSTDRGTILSLVGRAPETYQKRIESGQEPNPGRGILNLNPALEIQCAFPTDNESVSMDGLSATIQKMYEYWGRDTVPDIEKLPHLIPVANLPPDNSIDGIVLGKDQESLGAAYLSLKEDGPLFLITSMTSGLGKTSALYLWLAQLVQKYNPDQLKLILIDYHTRTLRYFTNLPHLANEGGRKNHVARKEDFKDMVNWLKSEVSRRKNEIAKAYSSSPDDFDDKGMMAKYGYILLVIDDYESIINNKPDEFQGMVSAIIDGEDVGVRLIVGEDFALLGNDDLIRRIKKYGSGLLFGGSDGLSTFNDARPPYNQKTTNLPAGRGYLIKRGQVQLIQAGAYWEEGQDRKTAIQKLLNKSKTTAKRSQ